MFLYIPFVIGSPKYKGEGNKASAISARIN